MRPLSSSNSGTSGAFFCFDNIFATRDLMDLQIESSVSKTLGQRGFQVRLLFHVCIHEIFDVYVARFCSENPKFAKKESFSFLNIFATRDLIHLLLKKPVSINIHGAICPISTSFQPYGRKILDIYVDQSKARPLF